MTEIPVVALTVVSVPTSARVVRSWTLRPMATPTRVPLDSMSIAEPIAKAFAFALSVLCTVTDPAIAVMVTFEPMRAVLVATTQLTDTAAPTPVDPLPVPDWLLDCPLAPVAPFEPFVPPLEVGALAVESFVPCVLGFLLSVPAT